MLTVKDTDMNVTMFFVFLFGLVWQSASASCFLNSKTPLALTVNDDGDGGRCSACCTARRRRLCMPGRWRSLKCTQVNKSHLLLWVPQEILTISKHYYTAEKVSFIPFFVISLWQLWPFCISNRYFTKRPERKSHMSLFFYGSRENQLCLWLTILQVARSYSCKRKSGTDCRTWHSVPFSSPLKGGRDFSWWNFNS